MTFKKLQCYFGNGCYSVPVVILLGSSYFVGAVSVKELEGGAFNFMIIFNFLYVLLRLLIVFVELKCYCVLVLACLLIPGSG